MPFIARGGTQDIAVAAGQTLIVGSYGAGQTKVYNGASGVNNQPPGPFSLVGVVSQGTLSLPYTSATTVRIDASPACDIEYSLGTTAATTTGPVTPPLSGQSVANALTAKAGGGQSAATPLTGSINRVTVCATAADSSILPVSVPGARISVRNEGAASMNVFPSLGENINAGAANAAFAVAAARAAIFDCAVAGTWYSILSA